MNTQKSSPAWIIALISMIISTTYLLYFEGKFWNNLVISNTCTFLLMVLLFRLRKNKHREMYLLSRYGSFNKRSAQYPFLIGLIILTIALFVSQFPYTTRPDLVCSFVYVSLITLAFEITMEVIERRDANIGKTIIKGLKKSPAIDKLDWSLLSEGSKHTLIFTCPNFTLDHIVRLLQKIFHKCKYEVLVQDTVFCEHECCKEKKIVEIVLFKENHRSTLVLECIGNIPEYTIRFSA